MKIAFRHPGGNLWRTDRTATGWSEPVRLPETVNASRSTFAPAVVADGSLYFMRPADVSGRFQLFRSQFSHGVFQAPVPLPFSDGSVNNGKYNIWSAPLAHWLDAQ